MAQYSVQKRRPDEEEARRAWLASQTLPSPKEPEAAQAIIPAGDTYAVMPIGGSGAPDLPDRFLQSPAGASPTPSAASASAPPQPIGYDDPILENLRQSIERLNKARMEPVKKQNRLKAFLKMAGVALSQTRGGSTWEDVARQAGSALGGGVSGVIQPKLPGAVEKMYNVQKLEDEVTQAEKYANVASNVQRRGDLTAQGERRIGIAEKKANLDSRFKEWQMKSGDKKLSLAQQKQKFLEQSGWTKIYDQETRNEWLQDIGERKFKAEGERFNVQQHLREKALKLAERRTAAYETAVKNNATKKGADFAADMAEAEQLNDDADEYEGMAASLDPDVDTSQIAMLRGQAIASRKRAGRLSARAGAKGASGADEQQDRAKPNKGITATQIGAMSEGEFRAYYGNTIPKPTPGETESAVKRWKKRFGK